MKFQSLLFVTLCLLANAATATLTPEQKKDFIQMYGKYKSSAEVLFFDINGDGVEEAIATSNDDWYSEDTRWDIFVLTKNGWEEVKRIENMESPRGLSGQLLALNSEFFAFTENGKPPQFVTVRNDGRNTKVIIDEDGFLRTEKFPVPNLSDSRRKLERLTPELHSDISPTPLPSGNDSPPPAFFERFNPATEPWIDDPSAVPAPWNGVWHPERERYHTDFNNDGLSDILLGTQLGGHYTLYLKNAKGKYKKYATFHGLYSFHLENKKKGTALLWKHQWDNPNMDIGTVQLGYHIITDKGVSDFISVQTFKKEDNGWDNLRQAYTDLREKSNAKTLYYDLVREYSETVKKKVVWRDDLYVHKGWKGKKDGWYPTEYEERFPNDDEEEEKDGTVNLPLPQNDESQSETNHLWLYAGILLGICAVFYFLRRKKP